MVVNIRRSLFVRYARRLVMPDSFLEPIKIIRLRNTRIIFQNGRHFSWLSLRVVLDDFLTLWFVYRQHLHDLRQMCEGYSSGNHRAQYIYALVAPWFASENLSSCSVSEFQDLGHSSYVYLWWSADIAHIENPNNVLSLHTIILPGK